MQTTNATLQITIGTGYYTINEHDQTVPETITIECPAQIEKTALLPDSTQKYIGFLLNQNIEDWQFERLTQALSDLEWPKVLSCLGTLDEESEPLPITLLPGMRPNTDNRISIQGEFVYQEGE